ncbi:uroporphyrinogen III methyltransferase [Thalassotalea insulae]|uniref:Uroporphyrinogen-III synthase n=1 Tax=Thalassotalea insulae TaxID=2056778 RepID=A0ABQ6GR36_9GAMM|nr:uroporphyrinogen-III synthase [Thalassotalea insulae]GLX78428.1 uroporphyrinogen III methyltransferase [Thalassotalea insulae]
MINKLPFVITRPEKQGLQLKQALLQAGVDSICQPLFEYQLATNKAEILNVQQNVQPHILIFVSVAAVNYANQAYPLSHWISASTTVIAVGQATRQTLTALGVESICPSQHDTEGMLSLPQLSAAQLANHPTVLIVRGNGGRELLATQLRQRGADTQYLESYQRVWLSMTEQVFELWQQKNVAGVIITSNALLQRVVDLINIKDNFWQNTCLWVVASERIKQTAQQLGLKKVINAQGADHQAIVNAVLTMGLEHD